MIFVPLLNSGFSAIVFEGSCQGILGLKFPYQFQIFEIRLEKYSLNFIPTFASFYIFCFHIQYHFRPQLIGNGASTLEAIAAN
jgi:hypothetical protein